MGRRARKSRASRLEKATEQRIEKHSHRCCVAQSTAGKSILRALVPVFFPSASFLRVHSILLLAEELHILRAGQREIFALQAMEKVFVPNFLRSLFLFFSLSLVSLNSVILQWDKVLAPPHRTGQISSRPGRSFADYSSR